jgi:transcriptional regulator with XRE-family HTH domain
VSHVSLVNLKRQAKRYGITQDEIASAASVGRSLVAHVFAGRAKSSNVVAVARRLVAARRAVGPRPRGRGREGEARPAVARQESTARAVLRHATGWAGDDLESRLAEVCASRSRTRA